MSSPFFDPEWMFGVSNGFDIVIGNPPYIQIQKFSGQEIQKQWENQKYQTFVKTGDIYTLFIEKGISSLKQNGLLTFITSNKWMRAGYGKALRKFLATKTNPLKLIDFGGYQVFESATVDSNILITQNGLIRTASPLRTSSPQSQLNACTIQKDFTIETSLNDYFNTHQQTISLKLEEAWVISSNIEQQIKEKIERIGTPLKDWDINIYRGILTGFNEAFIIDTKTKERLCLEDPKSAEIIKPILRGRDIKRYSAEWANLWLIFIPWHFPLHENLSISGVSEQAEVEFEKQYPAIYNYLINFKKELSQRNKEETGIRYEWYALQRCAATYLKEFEKEKIVWNRIASKKSFSLVKEGMLIQDSMHFFTGEHLKFLCGILNSSLFVWLMEMIVGCAVGGNAGNSDNVKQLPIPKIPESEQQPYIELVDKILYCCNKGLQPLVTNPLVTNTNRIEIRELEEKIDQLVYKLYELTEEEIKIVEGIIIWQS